MKVCDVIPESVQSNNDLKVQKSQSVFRVKPGNVCFAGEMIFLCSLCMAHSIERVANRNFVCILEDLI